MNKASSIQIKAAFLLIIFSLNMMVGFACSIGMDMGFNAGHHHQEEATAIHVHADGKKHHHEKAQHKPADKEDKKDDCCNDTVLKISQADKAVPQISKLPNPVFFTALVAAYYNFSISYPPQVSTSSKYFVRGHHPPIPDIRIAIQSFLL